MATDYTSDANCQAAYLFNDDFSDESGEGNTLTEHGEIAFSTSRPNDIGSGKIITFDGSNDWLDRPSDDTEVLSANFPGMAQKDDFAVAFWFKRASVTDTSHIIIGKGTNGSGWEFYITYGDSWHDLILRITNSGWTNASQNLGTFNNTNWYHVMMSFEGASPSGTATVWISSESSFGDIINGTGYTMTNINNLLGYQHTDGDYDFSIGAGGSGGYKFAGSIFQPIVFDQHLSDIGSDYSLTAAQVAEELYTYGIDGGSAGGSITPLVSYYNRRRR